VETGRLVADLCGHQDRVTSVVFSPDSCFVASGSDDSTVKVWEAETGRLIADCRGHTGRVDAYAEDQVTSDPLFDRRYQGVASVGFSPNGRLMASGSRDGTVKVWEAETGRLVADCCGHQGRVTSVVFSPDSCFVASGSDDSTVKVWEAESGRLIADCRGHQRSLTTSARFSGDGRFVVAGSSDHTVKVWEAETGRLVADCRGHQDWVLSVALSPNGRLVASGSSDSTVKVWDARNGECVNTLFFDSCRTVLYSGGDPSTCLVVADTLGQVFSYEIRETPEGPGPLGR
jgi:WD40 repeat protein